MSARAVLMALLLQAVALAPGCGRGGGGHDGSRGPPGGGHAKRCDADVKREEIHGQLPPLSYP